MQQEVLFLDYIFICTHISYIYLFFYFLNVKWTEAEKYLRYCMFVLLKIPAISFGACIAAENFKGVSYKYHRIRKKIRKEFSGVFFMLVVALVFGCNAAGLWHFLWKLKAGKSLIWLENWWVSATAVLKATTSVLRALK